jgi:uncharacterized protein YeaO (DUF488 family)
MDDRSQTMQQQQPRVRLGRVYDERTAEERTRVLVDRLWPRGLTRDRADLDGWCKHLRELAQQRALTPLTATRHIETSEAAVLTDLLGAGRAG